MTIRRLSSLCGVALVLGSFSSLPAAAQQPLTQTVPLFGDTAVEVEVDQGGAHFVPSAASNEVVVVSTAVTGNPPSPAPLQWTRIGKRVVVTLGRGQSSSSLPFVPKSQLAYEVSYPSRLKLIVHAFGGDVSVANPSTAVTVTEASGNVTIDNPRAPVSVDNQSGQITVHRAVAAIDLSADAGDIAADLDPNWLPRSIRMESAAGNLHLTVPANFSARVDASSQSGAVHNSLSRSAMTASGPPVWLYTEHGDVTIGFPPS